MAGEILTNDLKRRCKMSLKFIDFNALQHYHTRLCKYIDERIKAHNKAIILKECPSCGAHDFIMGNHLYECAYCGNKYLYQTLCDTVDEANEEKKIQDSVA